MQDEFAALAREISTMVEPGYDFLTLWGQSGGGACSLRLTAGSSAERVPLSHYPTTANALSGERPAVFELRVEADGTFEARMTDDIILEGAGYLPPIYTVVQKPRYHPPSEHTATSLADVEAVIGVSLPAEVHELFASGAETIGDDVRLLGIDDILYYWNAWAHQFGYYPQEWERPVQYLGPPGAVRVVQFDPKWVPIAFNACADLVCVDLAPGPSGRVGQLIQIAGEVPLTYLADSVAGWVPPADFPDYDHLSAHRPPDVAELPDTIQDLNLDDPSDRDLGLLARLTSLRDLVIGGGVVRLGGLSHLPLERIDVAGDEIELPACKTLRALVVRSDARVELPSLPSLRVLDVSGANVDVESLPFVEYLVLNFDQWQRCSQRPAAASLTGEFSLARLFDWARGLGVELDCQVFSGSVFPALP
ncbi:SMI1/KNR4 family protein [Lentzea sp. NPDC051213]|uniref:SMI1/KNR4 family protein n=1 Tax=Lentzea sp. NPDC051213 TaxID=3364126 RepID=UPI0037934770